MGFINPFGVKSANFIRRPIAQDSRLNILEGSIRSAKTWTMIPKLLALCDYLPQTEGLISGVSKTSIKTNVLNDLFRIVGPRRYKYNQQTGDLKLCGANWRVVGARDEGSEKFIRGSTYGKWYADELTLTPESFFKMALSRLSVPGARAYGTTNPGPPLHFIKKEYLDNHEMRARGDLWSEHFMMADNPSVSEEYKRWANISYTGVFKKRYIDGLWVAAEGGIYRDCFTDDLIYDDIPLGLYGPGGFVERYIGIDYGVINPMVFLDILDDGKTLWVIGEYYWDSKRSQQKTDGQYREDLAKFIANSPCQTKLESVQLIVDPSAASFKTELLQNGYWVVDADNDVEDGIRMVSSMFALKKVRVHRSCVNFINEHQAYCWDEKRADNGKEQPKKAMDHTCDAGRYVVKTKVNPWRLAA